MSRTMKRARNMEYRESRGSGFTLLELMLAIMILAIASSLTYMTISTVVTVWRSGTEMSDKLHHSDFIMEQLVMGLRSAYYPGPGIKTSLYGFWLEDNGDGEGSSDEICWVKQGKALVGVSSQYARGPHRVRFSIDETEEGEKVASIRAWRLAREVEDFSAEDLEPQFLPGAVMGFNCRVAYKTDSLGEIEWLDDWDETNKIPTAVEITLYLKPLKEDGEPIEVKRAVGIPVAWMCWK